MQPKKDSFASTVPQQPCNVSEKNAAGVSAAGVAHIEHGSADDVPAECARDVALLRSRKTLYTIGRYPCCRLTDLTGSQVLD